MDHAGLDGGAGPDGLDRVRQALEPVADQHEDVVDTAILDLGEDVHPVLGALAAVAGPQPEDVPPALDSDRQGHVNGPVGYRPVTDLHVDSVNKDHGIDGVERSVLPFGHAVEDLVGDRGDRLPGHLGSIDLGQVAWTSPVVRPFAASEMTISSTPDRRFCRFLTIFGSKLPSRSRGTAISTGPTSVSTVLARVPLRELPPFFPAGSCLS